MRKPNYLLAVALSTAGWSNAETARRINALALERGHRGLAVDHSRVGRWIRFGEKPRPPVPLLLTDLLTLQLERQCTPSSLGLSKPRVLQVQLEEAEHQALLRSAKCARLPPADYAARLLKNALSGA
ncbi:hypothetical protein ACFXGT_27760 [Streptomyces sp. NPDC059352]|uniref:hypothetical protein n=1 Tax=Streptomyces sp. NPDC059352 TaxID=3346810 RepID=UPI0036BE1078